MRHQENHLPARLAQGQAAQADQVARRVDVAEAVALARAQQTREAENIGQAIDVVKQLRAVNAACLEVLKKARASGDDATLLRAVDRLHRQIELQARLLGELQEAPQVNLVVLPEWQRIRVLVVEALQPYPEARRRVVQVLSDAGA